MGYNSTFTGSFRPSKAIPPDLVKRINDAELDVRVSGPGEDYEPGKVVPWATDMHGYNWVQDIVKVQRLLAKHGIRLRGELERAGESGDDFDKVEIRGGKVYYRPGHIAYGRREEHGPADVTRHAIRVSRVRKPPKGGEHVKLVGWVVPKGLMERTYKTCPPQTVAGKPVTDRAPLAALAHRNREEVEKIAGELSAKYPWRRYEVVSWEETV